MDVQAVIKEIMSGSLASAQLGPTRVTIYMGTSGYGAEIAAALAGEPRLNVVVRGGPGVGELERMGFVRGAALNEAWKGTFDDTMGKVATGREGVPVLAEVEVYGPLGLPFEGMEEAIGRLARDMGVDFASLQPGEQSDIYEAYDEDGLGGVEEFLSDLLVGWQNGEEEEMLTPLNDEVEAGVFFAERVGGSGW